MYLVPPFFEFYTYKSEHFLIHYHKEVEGIVIPVSEIADSIFDEYVKIFNYNPGRVNIVLIDAYDYSNAFASVIYENTIYIFLQNPFADYYFGFGSMESWLSTVISHELTHVFHLDYPHNINGLPIPSIIRSIFGRVPLYSFPNTLDPNWQIEGLAVYMESRNGFGRLNSGNYRNILLAYSKGNRVSPDIMCNNTSIWHGGNTPYIWGGLFTEYMSKVHGEDYIIHRFVKSSYFENTGCISMGFLPDEWLIQDSKDFENWRRFLREEARKFSSAEEFITNSGFSKSSLAISPSGKYMAYIENTTYDYPSLVILSGGKELARIKAVVLPWVYFEGDSTIYFSKYENFKNFFVFSDVYRWNFRKNKIRRITYGERAFSPFIYGDSLFYVRRKGLKQEVVVKVKDKPPKILISGNIYQGFNNLFVWNDTLFFSFNDDGKYDIGFFDLKSGVFSKITDDYAVDVLSFVDSGGVYFSRDEGSGYQVFLYKNGKFFTTRRKFFGVMYPRPYNGKIVAIFLDTKGYDIALINPTLVEKKIKKVEHQRDALPMLGIKPLSRRYNPLPGLLPKYWFPTVFFSDIFKFASLKTSGMDILYRYGYDISLSYMETKLLDSGYKYLNLSVYYTYTGVYPRIYISGNANNIMGKSMDISLEFPFYGFRSFKSLYLRSTLNEKTQAFGAGFAYSSAFPYKNSTLLAEGVYLSLGAMYINYGYIFGGIYKIGLRLGWAGINMYGGINGLSGFHRNEIYIFPNIFNPVYPDLNTGLLPPPKYHFYPILFLSRIYPSLLLGSYGITRVFYKYAGLVVMGDFVILGNINLSLGVGFTFYPKYGFLITVPSTSFLSILSPFSP